jgi:Leucine-rich repeat (LRR) protein
MEAALKSRLDGEEEGRVAAVDLRSQGLRSMSGLEKLTSLQSLNLAFNALTTICAWKPNQLRELILSDNRLTSLEGISNFTCLQVRDTCNVH